MLRTIWVWTQEWSDIPRRSAWTCAMYHQARTCSSSLTASRKPSSLRLPLLGARTRASAIASFGGLRRGPSGSGVGTRSSSLTRDRMALACELSSSRRPARGWSPPARRAAPRGSPARPRAPPPGRRCHRPIPRCRSRTGTCPGRCRPRRPRVGSPPDSQAAIASRVAVRDAGGQRAKASRRSRRSSARVRSRIRRLTTRIARWKRPSDGASAPRPAGGGEADRGGRSAAAARPAPAGRARRRGQGRGMCVL